MRAGTKAGFAGGRLLRSCRADLRSARHELGELPEVLGGGREVELVPGAIRAPQAEPIEPQDAFEVGEHHLHLLPPPPRCDIGLGGGDIPSHVAGHFMDRPQDLARGRPPGQQLGFRAQAPQSDLAAR